MNKASFELFLDAQIQAWNDGDKSGFFRAYRAAAPGGNEAACHNRNWLRGTTDWIETIELYGFDSGQLHIRYFINQTTGQATP